MVSLELASRWKLCGRQAKSSITFPSWEGPCAVAHRVGKYLPVSSPYRPAKRPRYPPVNRRAKRLKVGGSDVASEVPANEHPARDRHQLQTLILAITLLLTALLAVLVVIAGAAWLNRYAVVHFPLGFYLLAQGLLIFIVVVAFWFIRIQERIDLARSEREGLE